MNNAVTSAFVLIMLALFFAAGYYWGRNNNPLLVTEIRTDTVTTVVSVTDTLKPVFSVRKGKVFRSSSGIAGGNVWIATNNDSLRGDKPVILDQNDSGMDGLMYTASVDTVLADSAIALSFAFHSPVPLHPASYFTVAASLRQRDINRYTVISAQEKLSDRFGIGIIVGYAYMPQADKGGFVAGVGVCFRIW